MKMITYFILIEAFFGYLLVTTALYLSRNKSMGRKLRIIRGISIYILASLILSIYLSFSSPILSVCENVPENLIFLHLLLHLLLILYTWIFVIKNFI